MDSSIDINKKSAKIVMQNFLSSDEHLQRKIKDFLDKQKKKEIIEDLLSEKWREYYYNDNNKKNNKQYACSINHPLYEKNFDSCYKGCFVSCGDKENQLYNKKHRDDEKKRFITGKDFFEMSKSVMINKIPTNQRWPKLYKDIDTNKYKKGNVYTINNRLIVDETGEVLLQKRNEILLQKSKGKNKIYPLKDLFFLNWHLRVMLLTTL